MNCIRKCGAQCILSGSDLVCPNPSCDLGPIARANKGGPFAPAFGAAPPTASASAPAAPAVVVSPAPAFAAGGAGGGASAADVAALVKEVTALRVEVADLKKVKHCPLYGDDCRRGAGCTHTAPAAAPSGGSGAPPATPSGDASVAPSGAAKLCTFVPCNGHKHYDHSKCAAAPAAAAPAPAPARGRDLAVAVFAAVMQNTGNVHEAARAARAVTPPPKKGGRGK